MAGVDTEGTKIQEGEERIEQVEEESRDYKRARRPYTPTKAELAEHLPLHLQYREWCEECVRAKGLSRPHRSTGEDALPGVTWNMDYCFLGGRADEDIFDDDSEEKRRGKLPILVVYDSCKRAFWTVAVPQKGPVESIVKWCIDRLEDSGYIGEEITIKSDQEESIIALRKAISAARTGITTPVNSPVRCSKSNGQMERAVRGFQGQLRVLKFHFEKGMRKQLPYNSAMFTWLVVWTSNVLNKFKVQDDGRTVYENITKHRCNHPVVGFGECVQWQQTQDKNARDKLEGDWREGIFLGVVWRSTEYLIGTAEGIFGCRTIKPKVDGSAYDPDCTEYIKVSYSDFMLSGSMTQGARVKFADPEIAPPVRPTPTRTGNEFTPRRIYLKPADFLKFGYTEGCLGCTWLQNNLGSRRGHSDACRARIAQA